MRTQFSGIFAALVTPLDEAGNVSCETFERLMDFVMERGVSGVAVGGGTAEYPHYELEERKELMTRAARHLRERATLLAGIGASTLRATLELGRHAVDAGYDALLLPMPHFFRYEQHDVSAFCRTVARTLRAPCLLYNLPAFTNDLEADTAIKLLHQDEYIVGIKDSSGERGNLVRLAEARAQRGFSLLVGDDALALEALEAGWDGVVSGIACFLPELLVCLHRSYGAGDHQMARRCQGLLNELIVEIIKLPIPWGIRLGLEVRGIPTGPLPLPLSSVREQQISEYRRWLSAWLPRHLPVWAEALT
jgi:4-hydroxy-tetrahydrodipicolinate synthase